MLLTKTKLTRGYHKAYLDAAYQDKAYLGLSQSLPTQCLSGAITKLTYAMLTKTKLNYQGLSQSLPIQCLPIQCLPRQSLPGAITKLTHIMLIWSYHKAYLDVAYHNNAYLGLSQSLPRCRVPQQCLPGAITKLT